MNVATDKPNKLIYSLYSHQYLGLLFESFVVQLNDRGEFTYAYQNISSANINEFKNGIDATDIKLVKLMDAINQSEIILKFNKKKKVPVFDFFTSVFGPKKKDIELENSILKHINKHRIEILKNIGDKPVFVMGKDGNPVWKKLEIVKEKAKAYFHFDRQEKETYYYPIVKAGGEKVKFQFKNAILLSENPAFLLVNDKLYSFDEGMDGKKIKPFFDKSNIVIPRKIEANYFKNFVVPLVSMFNVYARGFEIKTVNKPAKAVLKIKEIIASYNSDLFENKEPLSDNQLAFELHFNYGQALFPFDVFSSSSNVFLEKDQDSWLFTKIPRHLEFEKRKWQELKQKGLPLKTYKIVFGKTEGFVWLQKNMQDLLDLDFEIIQENENGKNYFLGSTNFDLEITEKNDWFDIQVKINFGKYEIPFVQIRNYILKGITEFPLPDGSIAVIPNEWFIQYPDLFKNSDIKGDEITLKKVFVGLVQDLSVSGIAKTILSRKLEHLQNFTEIEEFPLPTSFNGELRPYQKAGYNWLHFLKDYNFGGCLADEMGLGKTIITLAFLQSVQENKAKYPSILIMPTSLVYNWVNEAEKFTPTLKVLAHIGTNREKSTEHFVDYDLIVMSYGILRLDIGFLNKFKFNYAILDESQAIKNPKSQIAKAVTKLNTINRIILTGTPLENSTLDLWSQYSFINPALLGSFADFKNNFQIEIEKKRSEEANAKLLSKIKPFLLRRTKSQVAKELPEKIESVIYSQMTEEQEKIYEETKSAFRNSILENSSNSILVLEGLNKLRQIANHPAMIDSDFSGESGKENDIMHRLKEIVSSGSKVLVFSQFVKHLSLIKKNLETEKIPFLYLDGSTRNRGKLVDQFQNSDDEQIFLISLKAGGVGLNLTAATYVFILDPWWNPAAEAQAIDRAHRIGQENTVFTYKFISKNTLEEKILKLQQKKKRLFKDLINTEESFNKQLSKEDLVALLN